MSLKNAYDNFNLAVSSGMLADKDPSECHCRGWGWILSDFDTWHECPIHTGRYHPETLDRSDGPEFEWHGKFCWLKAGPSLWILKGWFLDYSEEEHGANANPHSNYLEDSKYCWAEYRLSDDGKCVLTASTHQEDAEYASETAVRIAVARAMRFRHDKGHWPEED